MGQLCSAHFLRVSILAAALSTISSPAQATIVYGGREVRAWPDLEQPRATPADVAFDVVGAPNIHLFPHPSGVVHGLTILVDFSDQSGAYSKQEIDAWLNTKGYTKFGLTGSIRDYYLKQSNGKVDYQNEVHGFYRAKKPKSYYQGGTDYARADELWAEVIEALDADIDFSLFDNDGDGKTEAISLLYAGDEGTFGKGLWPHAGASNQSRDGVRLSRYMMTAMDEQPTNYVFAHESGHMLFGWPDLYGVGDYSIMANRGANTNPVGVDDVLRADQGWIDIIDVQSTTNARYQASPNGAAYRYLNPARPSEYFLWSNVQKANEWVSLAAGGLLIWHFDKSIGANNPPEPLELAVVQGAGTRQLSATTWPSPGSAKTDFFGAGVNTELGLQTSPASTWNNSSASGLRIYDIGQSSASIGFSVGVGPLPTAGAGGAGGEPGTSMSGAGGVSGQGGAGLGSGGANAASGGAAGSANGGAQSGAGANAAGNAGTAETAHGGAANAANGGGAPFAASPSSGADAGCSCSSAARPRGRSGLYFGFFILACALARRARASRRRDEGAS